MRTALGQLDGVRLSRSDKQSAAILAASRHAKFEDRIRAEGGTPAPFEGDYAYQTTAQALADVVGEARMEAVSVPVMRALTKQAQRELNSIRATEQWFKKRDDLGRAPKFWWRGPIPRDVKACFPTKQALLRVFADENYQIIENYGGIDYEVSPAEFDAINHKYSLTGKNAARSIADAIWAALPPQPRAKYCFEDIDLQALNDTSPAHEAEMNFRLPDWLEEQRLVDQEAEWYREHYGVDGVDRMTKKRRQLGIAPYQAKQLSNRFGRDWYKVLKALDYDTARSITTVAKRAGISKKRAETIMDEMTGWELATEVQHGKNWRYRLTDEGGHEIMRRRGLGYIAKHSSPKRKKCYEKLDRCMRKANTRPAERKCNQQFRKCTRR